MPPPRVAASLLVGALIRRIEAEGGTAAVIAKGDVDAGAVVLLLSERGCPQALVERWLAGDRYRWQAAGPADPAEWTDYLARRRSRDPDLWVVELEHPQARAIADAIG